jgi:hypothetical protein
MFEIWSDWEEFAREKSGSPDRISEILLELENAGILEHIGSESYTLQVSQLPTALCALYFDLKVRAALFANIKEHMVALLQLKDRLEQDDAHGDA